MLKYNDTQLLSVKELAWRLNRHLNFVYSLRLLLTIVSNIIGDSPFWGEITSHSLD